jgi:hypothetical protein
VRGVGCDEVLVLLERRCVRRLEERAGRARIAARAAEAPSLEVDAGGDDAAPAAEHGRFVEECVSRVEVASKPAQPRELREYLGASLVELLRIELRPQSSFRRFEIVEVPERSKPVVHLGNPKTPRVDTLGA